MIKLCLAFALALGLSACVDDPSMPTPPTEDEDEEAGEDPTVPVDPPGDNVPGKGDCGAQLQDDDTTCTPQ
jgi:hypothetical protein